MYRRRRHWTSQPTTVIAVIVTCAVPSAVLGMLLGAVINAQDADRPIVAANPPSVVATATGVVTVPPSSAELTPAARPEADGVTLDPPSTQDQPAPAPATTPPATWRSPAPAPVAAPTTDTWSRAETSTTATPAPPLSTVTSSLPQSPTSTTAPSTTLPSPAPTTSTAPTRPTASTVATVATS